MKKSLFRLAERFELLICYVICFAFNMMFDYVETLSIDSYILQSFIKQFSDYRTLIIFLITFVAIIFHYKMLNGKKEEIYCRVLVGDMGKSITIRYILECLVILVVVFVISMITNIILGTGFANNIYLSCVLIFYILLSSGMVNRFENL